MHSAKFNINTIARATRPFFDTQVQLEDTERTLALYKEKCRAQGEERESAQAGYLAEERRYQEELSVLSSQIPPLEKEIRDFKKARVVWKFVTKINGKYVKRCVCTRAT